MEVADWCSPEREADSFCSAFGGGEAPHPKTPERCQAARRHLQQGHQWSIPVLYSYSSLTPQEEFRLDRL